MMITFYGYKSCSTCKQAQKNLDNLKIEFQFIDITLYPPSASQLSAWLLLTGLPLKNWFNTSGVQYRELNIKDKLLLLTAEEACSLLASNGKLIKRPIVSNDTMVSVGYNAIKFNQTWSTLSRQG